MPRFPSFEDCPEFKFLDPEVRKDQVAINEFLEKLDPYSLFLYAQAQCINICVDKRESVYETAKQLSLTPEKASAIYGSSVALSGMIVHRKRI